MASYGRTNICFLWANHTCYVFVKSLFFSHNFSPKNARWPIKGFQDSYYNLHSKTFESINFSTGLRPRSRWSGPKMPKPTPFRFMTSPTKNTKIQNFPIFWSNNTRLPASLEGLNSYLAYSAGQLWFVERGQIPGLKVFEVTHLLEIKDSL